MTTHSFIQEADRPTTEMTCDDEMVESGPTVQERLQKFWNEVAPIKSKNPVDQENLDDPNAVSAYAEDILRVLKSQETQCMPSNRYLRKQRDITKNMRGILIDWIVEVHYKWQ